MTFTGKQLYDAIMQASHEVHGVDAEWQGWEDYVVTATDEAVYVRAAEILSEQS
jgi:hypothetical protein